MRYLILTPKLLLKTVVFCALTLPLTLPANASAARTQADLLRGQLLRLHGRLEHEALQSQEVLDANAAAAQSYARLYQIRQNIVIDVAMTDEYADVKLALWQQQQLLQGLHVEVPAKVAAILATASDSLTLRSKLNKLETDALEANDAYVAARDEFNGLVAAQNRITADALDQVRNDPEFAALSQQLQAAQRQFSHRIHAR